MFTNNNVQGDVVFGKNPNIECSICNMHTNDPTSSIIVDLLNTTENLDIRLTTVESLMVSDIMLDDAMPGGVCSFQKTTLIDEVTISNNTAKLTFRPLISSDNSVDISHNTLCNAIDLKVIGGGGGGSSVWQYTTDVGTGKDVLRANPLHPLYSTDAFYLFGSQQLNSSNGGNPYLLYSLENGAIRAGSHTGSEWDLSNLGARSAAFGLNNMAKGADTAVFGAGNTANGSSGFIAGSENVSVASGVSYGVLGASNSVFDSMTRSVVLAGASSGGQIVDSAVFGSNVLAGQNAHTGTVTGPITGAFGAFDSAAGALDHFMNKDHECKMIFKNGFVRGGGGSGSLGNDGPREHVLPLRMEVPATATQQEVLLELSDNHVVISSGYIVVVNKSDFSQRNCFTYEGCIVSRVSSSPAVLDNPVTLYEVYTSPSSLFLLNLIDFNISGNQFVVSITAPAAYPIVAHVVHYNYDLIRVPP